jgi:hypothetical protein
MNSVLKTGFCKEEQAGLLFLGGRGDIKTIYLQGYLKIKYYFRNI